MIELLIYICLAGEINCTKDNAVQTIRVPLQQIAINCGQQAQSYVVQNSIDLEGLQIKARCRLGGG